MNLKEFRAYKPIVGRLSCKEPNVKQMSKIIYLACPYASPDPAIRRLRFEMATRVARTLTLKGYLVFSPITHAHPLQVEVRNGWDFWKQLDVPFLEQCGLLMILKMPGWDKSVGIDGEVNTAYQNGIPSMYIEVHEVDKVCDLVETWDFLGHFLKKEA